MPVVAGLATLCALSAFALPACAEDALALQRFPLFNRAPFTAILGIPDGWVDAGGPAAELSWDIANNASIQQAGDERLELDGETHTLTLRLQHRYGRRLSFGAEVPWIAHNGGFLDRPIDAWHETFGLHEGIRPLLPTGQLQFVYIREGVQEVALDDATSGLGDVRTSAAWSLFGGGGEPLRADLLADIEWPTGDPDRLTGSGSTDVAAGLRLARPASPPGSRFGWSLTGGLVWPGDVDPPLPAASARIVYYDAALSWAAARSFDLVLQVQGNTAAYRSDLEMLGSSAMQLGGGFLWRFSNRFGVRLGIFEDIRTDTAPDFATQLSLFYLSPR